MLDLTNHIWINKRLSARVGRFVARCFCRRRHWSIRVMVYTFTGPLSERSILLLGGNMPPDSNRYARRISFTLIPPVRLTLLLSFARRAHTTARTVRSSRSLQGY